MKVLIGDLMDDQQTQFVCLLEISKPGVGVPGATRRLTEGVEPANTFLLKLFLSEFLSAHSARS
ncbi:MAG: hypothetical protein RR713_06390, partial [Aurantimicrobium sp.]